MRLTSLCLALALTAALPLRAENQVPYPELPPIEMVGQAMSSYAPVLAAEAGIRMEDAAARELRAGPHEYSLRLGSQRRSVVPDPAQRFREWEIGLESAFRLPGKASLDEELGSIRRNQAMLSHGDALHEAGRSLLGFWFAWLREHYQAMQWQQQVDSLGQQAVMAEKRRKAGDAPALEAMLAEAALAQAESSLKQARMREQLAATDIAQRFPAIRLPAAPVLSLPRPLEQGLDYWQEAILTHSHELALIRGEAQQSRVIAARTRADRLPDPTLGLRYAQERSGEERIVGLSVSIPLPGGARAAAAERSEASAEMARYREVAVLAKLNAEIIKQYEAARAAYYVWNKSREVAGRMRRNADLMSRAYSMGEIGLAEVLQAGRQANEAELGATLAQLDALEGSYRLKLDAHQLWPLDRD